MSTPVIELVLRATLVLGAGFLLAALHRKGAAGTRHAIWAATLGMLLTLPLLGIAGVRLPLAVLPAPGGTPAVSSPSRAVVPPAVSPASKRGEEPSGLQVAASSRPPLGKTLGRALLVYLAGTCTVLFWIGCGLLHCRRLARGARRFADEDAWKELMRDAGGGEHVRLLHTADVAVPMTWGLFRPTILFPRQAVTWKNVERRQALMHELAHVQRRDWAVSLMARLVCAVYWFHPLAWKAAGRLSLESEHACDDRVLLSGAHPDEYAAQLCSLSRRLRNASKNHLQSALGMARSAHVSERIDAILDRTTRRSPMSRSRLALAVSSTILVAVLITSTDLVPARDRSGAEPGRPGFEALVNELIRAGGDVDTVFEGDGTLLIQAAAGGRRELVERLIAAGAGVNTAVRGDGNPLIAAARGGHIEIVRILVESGARVDQVVPGDENALIQAAWNGHLEVVEFLVEAGADVNIVVLANGNEQRSALQMARKGGHDAVVAALVAAGATRQ